MITTFELGPDTTEKILISYDDEKDLICADIKIGGYVSISNLLELAEYFYHAANYIKDREDKK